MQHPCLFSGIQIPEDFLFRDFLFRSETKGDSSKAMELTQDVKWMRRALKLADKGWGRTRPNPLVGCVIVRDGEILAEGYHAALGRAHAERAAIEQAQSQGIDLTGATLYVNLEPCSHFGRTPPCADLIVENRLARVVVAMEDPNPLVAGRGIQTLRTAGIEVTTGVLELEARQLNEIFIKHITTGKPFVILKAAISIDGKIATHTGESKWISGAQSRKLVHRWRSRTAAILVGINTILQDDPSLTTRLHGKRDMDPARIIVDSTGRLTPQHRVFNADSKAPVIAATTSAIDPIRAEQLQKAGATLLVLDGPEGQVDLQALIDHLGESGIDSILLEGGGRLNEAFLRAGLVDKIMLFMAPKIIGGSASIACFHGEGTEHLTDAIPITDMTVTPVGEDFLIEGYPQKPGRQPQQLAGPSTGNAPERTT
jgi:diaminohydroxyphosphoribosylaminopyrimidine deaminase/5-amino-6-(5-phosphoribosylamino)uracil reductase